jgi:hypothetical protein
MRRILFAVFSIGGRPRGVGAKITSNWEYMAIISGFRRRIRIWRDLARGSE